MAKLNPPVIDGTIPAFAKGTALAVPFSMNKGVSKSSIKGYSLKIKTVAGDVITQLETDRVENNCAIFTEKSDIFKIGQYYKIQLAYIDQSGIIGYYSTVGVVKCTSPAELSILTMRQEKLNPHMYNYIGTYSNSDVTEKMYSCKFVIYDAKSNIYLTSGDLLHNTSEDIDGQEQVQSFSFAQDLPEDEIFYVQFIVTTVNEMVVASSKYKITQQRFIKLDLKTELHADLDYENGMVELTMLDEQESVFPGHFVIVRKDDKDNVWRQLRQFESNQVAVAKWSFRDLTVEHGRTYTYGLQLYNNYGIYSTRIESNSVKIDFEDMFLYDGERQLKLKFNPKVSTFKIDVLEAKQDTIGGVYPYITRNGHTFYRELAISGLISHLSDEAEMFMTKEDIGLPKKYLDISRVENYHYDLYQKYKDAVAEIKLAATEEEKAQARKKAIAVWQLYCQADSVYTYRDRYLDSPTDLTADNLFAEKIFKTKVLEWLNNGQPKLFRSVTEGNFIVRVLNTSLSPTDSLGRMLHTSSSTAYEIADYTIPNLQYYGLLDMRDEESGIMKWSSVDLLSLSEEPVEILPVPAYSIAFVDVRPGTEILINGTPHVIGSTGAYQVMVDEPITSVIVGRAEGVFTYGYKSTISTVFNHVTDIDLEYLVLYSFVGAYDNVLDALNNYHQQMTHYSYIRISKRDEKYDDKGNIRYEHDDYNVEIDGEIINVEERSQYVYQDVAFSTIKTGDGVMVEVGGVYETFTYDIEDEEPLKSYKAYAYSHPNSLDAYRMYIDTLDAMLKVFEAKED